MSTIIKTAVHSGNNLAANIKPDYEQHLMRLDPYQTPAIQYLFFSNKKSKPVKDKRGRIAWFEKELFPHQTDVTVAITVSSGKLTLTSSNVANVDIFNVGDIVYIEDNDEQAIVESFSSGNCVLAHVDGSTALTAISSTGGYLKILGNINHELAGLREPRLIQEVEVFNYLTIFSETVRTSGRDQAGENWTDGKSHDELVVEEELKMKLYLERNAILSSEKGRRNNSDGIPMTYGMGLNGFLQTNRSSYSTLNEATWDAYLDTVFAKGGFTRLHYCGSTQHTALTAILKAKMGGFNRVFEKEYGARLATYHHSKGDVKIIFSPVCDGKFTDWGFTVDPKNWKARHMANDKKGSRKFRVEHNVETKGEDQTATKLLADVGWEYIHEETGGVLYKAA